MWRFRDWGDGVRLHHVRRATVRGVWPELLFGWTAVSGQVLYRTAVVRSAGGFPTKHPRVHDRDLWLRIARRGPVALEPSVVADYRVHPGQSDSHTPSPGAPDDIGIAREALWQDTIRALPPRRRRAALRIRRSADAFAHAEDALRGGRAARALVLYAAAVAASPTLALSPLVGPPLRWGGRRALRRLVVRTP
jgi:hypothetical protein